MKKRYHSHIGTGIAGITDCLTEMTVNISRSLETVAKRLPEPQNLFVGVDSILKNIPANVLQFHRHDDRYMLTDKPAYHHRFVLISCIHEPGCIILDGEIFKLEQGQGILIFPYQSHHYTRFKHPARISWLFTTFEYKKPEELEDLRNTPFTYEAKDLLKLAQVTTSYIEWFKSRKNTGSETPLELSILLCRLLHRQHRYIRKAGGRLSPDMPDMNFLQPLSNFIHKNLNRQISIREIADCVHLSPSRLRAKFRNAIGISLGEFTRRTRIHRACGLLHSTDLNMTQVAEECGFNSVFSFSRTFRSVTGKAPTKFREEMQRRH